MSRHDPSNASCHVYTFKEGLLSAVAHDLKIAVERFTIDEDREAGTLEATFDPRSLRVMTAMKDGQENPSALSPRDVKKIEGNIVKDVLEADRYPEVRFVASGVEAEGDGYRIRGTLTLHGKTRPVTLSARREGSQLVVTHRLHQPDYGIKPYSAMLGTLKIKPDVEVRVVIAAEG